jgi:hypothetical protein
MCPDCGRAKMLFETERKARDFIKWNGDDINTHGGELRPYYCPSCCGWHLTSKVHNEYYDHRTEELIGAYQRSIKATKTVIKDGAMSQEYVDWDAIPDKIWSEILDECKEYSSISKTRKFVSEYYKEHGILENDGGRARKLVYDKWCEHRYEMFHVVKKG